MADTGWIAAVAALGGTALGAAISGGFQWWQDRERRSHDRRTAYENIVITGIADYLAEADTCFRYLMRLHNLPLTDTGRPAALDKAEGFYRDMQEKSNLIALMTGDVSDPVRDAAYRLREPIKTLYREAKDERIISKADRDGLTAARNGAREDLIQSAQKRYLRWSPKDWQ